MKREKKISLIIGIGMLMVAVLFMTPLYYVLINAFKEFRLVVLETGAFPRSLYLDNFMEIIRGANFPVLFRNSVIVTTCSVAGIVLFGSMAGYKLARMRTRWSSVIVFYFLLTLIIPFQAIMIPVVVLLRNLRLMDSLFGLILVYTGLGIPVGVFLYYGGVKAIPRSMEESAYIDGAGKFKTFFLVIFPMLKPITSTVIILEALWVWNDFLLPLIVLQSDSLKTITVGTMSLIIGQYMARLNLAAAAAILASAPMLVLYIFLQRYIIKGFVDGAVKG